MAFRDKAIEIIDELYENPKHKFADYPHNNDMEFMIDCMIAMKKNNSCCHTGCEKDVSIFSLEFCVKHLKWLLIYQFF